jgi:predicted amidohydrolase YtcJ
MNAMARTALCLFLLLTPWEAVLAANDEPIGEHNKYQVADLVFRNGAVYTVDAARSWASAVAVAGNRIVYVGTDDGAAPFVGAATRVVDLRGRMMLPGFQDSHVHPSGGGINMTRIQLNGVFDRGEVFLLLGEYADAHSGLEWIVGSGWEADAFKPSGSPDRHMLDEIIADRPVYLTFSGTHAAWVNSRALEIAGITATTPDPLNGVIKRDGNGEPTGLLIDTAQELVSRHIPSLTDQQRVDAFRLALTEITRLGITAIIDASTSYETESSYAAVAASGDLNLRTTLCQRYQPQGDDEQQVQVFLGRR